MCKIKSSFYTEQKCWPRIYNGLANLWDSHRFHRKKSVNERRMSSVHDKSKKQCWKIIHKAQIEDTSSTLFLKSLTKSLSKNKNLEEWAPFL